MKEVKIDFKKIEKLEKNPKKVEETVWYWANKAVKDQNLSWDDAMNSACKELGINRAELVTLIYANEPFEDLAYVTSRLEMRKLLSTEGDRIIKNLLGDKKLVRKHVSRQ
ncbi:MAG: hypothetical protein ACE5J3_08780 [Methanosarcinales archaeon]